MKRFLYNVLVILMLFVFAAPSAFGGIPISERASEVSAKANLTPSKRITKLSKLKQKIAQKIISKRMEGENKTAAIVFAVLLPFVGVAIYQDRISKDFWITLLLTALLYVPGLIYALSIVLKRTH